MIELALRKMHWYGEVREEWYELHDFDINIDSHGVKYIFASTVDHLYRSKSLYHDAIIETKSALIDEEIGGMIEAHEKSIRSARNLLTNNTLCEDKLTEILRNKGAVTANVVDSNGITPANLIKCTVLLLTALYIVRTEAELVLKPSVIKGV